MQALAEDVKNHPDAYQYERAQRFGMSTRGMCDAHKRLGISRKKTLEYSKAQAEKRNAFSNKIKTYKLANRPLIYIAILCTFLS